MCGCGSTISTDPRTREARPTRANPRVVRSGPCDPRSDVEQPAVSRQRQRRVQECARLAAAVERSQRSYLTDKVVGLISTAGGTHGLQPVNAMEFAVRALRG